MSKSWRDITDEANWQPRYLREEVTFIDGACPPDSDAFVLDSLASGVGFNSRTWHSDMLASDIGAHNAYSWDGTAWVPDHLDDTTDGYAIFSFYSEFPLSGDPCTANTADTGARGMPYLKYVGPTLVGATKVRLTLRHNASFDGVYPNVGQSPINWFTDAAAYTYISAAEDSNIVAASSGDTVVTEMTVEDEATAAFVLGYIFGMVGVHNEDGAYTTPVAFMDILAIEVYADDESEVWTDFAQSTEG